MQGQKSFKTILTYFQHFFKTKTTEKIIEFKDEWISSQLFWQRTREKSIQLQKLFFQHFQRELHPGECIGLASHRTLETLSDMLAILFAGGAFVPFNTNALKEQKQFIFNDAEIAVYLDNGCINLVAQELSFSLLYDIKSPVSQLNVDHILPSQLAYIMYTSGSSGKPKGVKISHAALWHYCKWVHSLDVLHECQRIDFSTNLTFDAAITTSLVVLAAGKTISICPEETKVSPQKFINYLIEKKIDLCKCTPSFFRQLRIESEYSKIIIPQSLKWLLTGEEMQAKDTALWLQMHPHHIFYNSYGPTEATVTCSKFKIDITNIEQFKLKIPIEKDSRSCQFIVTDSDLNPVPNGVKGELCIGGTILASGYLNRPEETNKSFVYDRNNNLLYRTGDEVMATSDGFIYYFGRLDSQVKIRGIRIELSDITSALCSLQGIVDARVIAFKKNDSLQLFAFLVSQSQNLEDHILIKNVKAEFGEKYSTLLMPDYFLFLDKIPTNSSGKSDIAVLENLARQYSLKTKKQLATNPLEISLLQIWRETLPPNKMGIDTDFFALGGHSLLAMEVTDRINDQLNTNLQPNILFQNPTIRKLAKAIEDTSASHSLHHISHSSSGPVLCFIHPATGLAHLYYVLKSELENYDFYVMSNDRFGNQVNCYQSIEEMAHSYLQILLQHCPNRSYIIGGFCMGGVVAYEMVKQLQAQRKQSNVALILIDSFKLKYKSSDEERNIYNKMQLQLRSLPEESVLGQKIIHELDHNHELVVAYQQKKLTSDCLFIECKDLLPEEKMNKNFYTLKNENLGWNLSDSQRILIKKEIIAYHRTLFIDDNAIHSLGNSIKEFITLLQYT